MTKLPGKNILILGAVCLSIIAGTGAYKIAQAARIKTNATLQNGIVASTGPDSTATNANSNTTLLNALQEIEMSSTTDSSADPFAPSPDDTMTARLSKNFFVSYAQTQTGQDSSGNPSDPTALADPNSTGATPDDTALVNNALSTVDTSSLPKDKYVASDLNVVSGNTADELKKYGNDFMTIQNNELLAIQQNPDKYQNDIGAIGDIYAIIAAKLAAMPVPIIFAPQHLIIVNAFYITSEDFKLIADQSKDPLKSLLGLRQYKDTLEQEQQMYTEISDYFNANGILFNDTEPGYFWTTLNIATSTQENSLSSSGSSDQTN